MRNLLILITLLTQAALTAQTNFNFLQPTVWCKDCCVFTAPPGGFIQRPSLLNFVFYYSGDFDGDGKDDVLTFPAITGRKAQVILSNGTAFQAPFSNWGDNLVGSAEMVLVGDFNGDKKDDIAMFTCGAADDVFVALSNGSSFDSRTKWHDNFCYTDAIPQAGDFNGDGRDDIAAFTRKGAGDVFVALSTGTRFNGDDQLWHGNFCYNNELPLVGDFDGNGKDDIATFTRLDRGDVFVALSDGSRFNGDGVVWHTDFCFGTETPLAGDFNGDGKDDLITIRPDGNVGTALSSGKIFKSTSALLRGFCCTNAVAPMVGKFNNDPFYDLASIGNPGSLIANSIQVSLSSGLFEGAVLNGSTTFLPNEDVNVLGDTLTVWNGIPAWFGGAQVRRLGKLNYGDRIKVLSYADPAISPPQPWQESLCQGHSASYKWVRVACTLINDLGVKEPTEEGWVKDIYLSKALPTFGNETLDEYLWNNFKAEPQSLQRYLNDYSAKKDMYCTNKCFNRNNGTNIKVPTAANFSMNYLLNNNLAATYSWKDDFNESVKDLSEQQVTFLLKEYFRRPEEIFLLMDRLVAQKGPCGIYAKNKWRYIATTETFLFESQWAYTSPSSGPSSTPPLSIPPSTTYYNTKLQIKNNGSTAQVILGDCQPTNHSSLWPKVKACWRCTEDKPTIITNDRDEIHCTVQFNAVDLQGVHFRLQFGNDLTSKKIVNLPDGQGSNWDIVIEGNTKQADESLWAGQVNNGQSLTFSKSKGFWPFSSMKVVVTKPISDFFPLPPGSRLVFTWAKDN